MNVILFGFKGVGKTYLGKLLSKKLKRPFIDTDDCIVEMYGKPRSDKSLSIRDIYQVLGEEGFRLLEKNVIHMLQSDFNAIVAVGGGAVLDPKNRVYLKEIGHLIYLKASFDTLQKRILENGSPSFVDAQNPLKSLHAIYEKRLPIYEAIPAKCLDVDLLDEAECIAALCSMISKESRLHAF